MCEDKLLNGLAVYKEHLDAIVEASRAILERLRDMPPALAKSTRDTLLQVFEQAFQDSEPPQSASRVDTRPPRGDMYGMRAPACIRKILSENAGQETSLKELVSIAVSRGYSGYVSSSTDSTEKFLRTYRNFGQAVGRLDDLVRVRVGCYRLATEQELADIRAERSTHFDGKGKEAVDGEQSV